MEKVLTLEDVFGSKTFVKGEREYKSPKEYLEPFIERVSQVAPNISVQVSGKIQNAEEDKTINTAFSRIMIEASNEKMISAGVFPTYGIIIALDPVIPIYKIYEGLTVRACTNLCVFNSRNLYTGQIFDGMGEGYGILNTWVNSWKETFGANMDIFSEMEKKPVPVDDVTKVLGNLLKFGIENKYFGTNPVIHAAKELYDPNSIYYVGKESTTAWNMYNAVTSYLSTKTDIVDKASKTLLLSKFFIN